MIKYSFNKSFRKKRKLYLGYYKTQQQTTKATYSLPHSRKAKQNGLSDITLRQHPQPTPNTPTPTQ